MVALSDIERTGPDRRASILRFDDGTDRRTSFAVVRALMLEPGPVSDRSVLEADLRAAELEQARERSLHLLGYRERSRHELVERLSDDGYPAVVANEVVADLERAGLVDDARFAEAWTRTRARAGRGPHRILQELRAKGIDPDAAREALAETFADDDEVAAAVRLLAGKPLASRQDRERALRRLLSRGFSSHAALRAVEQAGGRTPEDPGGDVLET